MHLGKRRRALGQFAAATAGQQILDTARGKAFEQIQHLLGAAVEIGTALDVQDSHGATPGSARNASSTSSTPMSRMQ